MDVSEARGLRFAAMALEAPAGQLRVFNIACKRFLMKIFPQTVLTEGVLA